MAREIEENVKISDQTPEGTEQYKISYATTGITCWFCCSTIYPACQLRNSSLYIHISMYYLPERLLCSYVITLPCVLRLE